MTGLADCLPMLVEIRRENRQIVRANADDSEKDRNGSCTNMLALDLRFFAVADYLRNGDVESFKAQLSEAAQLRSKLFSRFEHGEPIDGSYITMLSYKALFDALAADDMEVAKLLASHMGGRDALEQEHDHQFDSAMGYTLRAFALNDSVQMQEWAPKLIAACKETAMTDFSGYGQVFQAILSSDSAAANEGMKAVVKGHQKQLKGNGVFANTEDELLCVWGVGMAHLAQLHGLQIEAVPPLIPQDLLAR